MCCVWERIKKRTRRPFQDHIKRKKEKNKANDVLKIEFSK